jgi:hypothetical protein
MIRLLSVVALLRPPSIRKMRPRCSRRMDRFSTCAAPFRRMRAADGQICRATRRRTSRS